MRPTSLCFALLLSAACGRSVPTQSAHDASKSEPLESSRVLVRATEAPVIDIRVSFDAGSIDDPRGREGLTFVTAATMAEGGAGGRTFAERERLLFPMAASIDVQIEREQVVFSGRAHRDHWAAFYPLFRDMLLDPTFDAADVQRVGARTLSQLTQDLRGADDETLGKEMLQAMLFEAHPYGRPALGTETGLTGLSADELRAQRARALCAARVQVALSGAIDASFVDMLRADLGALPRAECTPRSALAAPTQMAGRRMWLVDKPEAQSVAISMGLPLAVSRTHPDYAALTLAAAYLGQHRTFAGRLMQKMRGDRGLNYGDYAYAEHFAQDGSSRFPRPNVARRSQYFSIWLRPVPLDKAHFALRMAVRELDLFAKDGLTQDAFESIQRFVNGYFALFAQTEQARLGHDLDRVFYGSPAPDLDTLRAQMAALTREQVNAAIRKHVDVSRLQVAVVSPDAARFAQAIAAETASPIQYASEKPAEVLAEDKLIEAYPVGITQSAIKAWPLPSVFR